ncbi:hypothetical protein LRS56_05090 [Pseudomonas poae]|nr:hypothetical protein LRS56_05090 [Pseudomonas poae]
MKSLAALALIAMLAGCASHGKSETQIFDEATTAYVASLPAKPGKVYFYTTKIPSHGLISDSMMIAMAGSANATSLKEQLLSAKNLSRESGFLIFGASTSVDVAIIGNAVEGLDLKGMQIYYSGTGAQKDQVRTAIEKTQAQFHYINAQ